MQWMIVLTVGPGGILNIKDTFIKVVTMKELVLSDNGFGIPKSVHIEHAIIEDCQQN